MEPTNAPKVVDKIDASNAGRFGSLAYQPIGSSVTDSLGPNWYEDQRLSVQYADPSSGTVTNQMRVLVNDETRQVTFAFKGSNTISNFKSDIVDSGASEYATIHDRAVASYQDAKQEYAGYEIVTAGHSLGGGMAQSFSLELGLDGWAQNSLPVASQTLQDYFPGQNPATLVADYREEHQFIQTNVSGDIATLKYSTLEGQIMLDNNPTTLPSAWGAVTGLGLLTCGFTSGAGCAVAFGAGVEAHLLSTHNPLAEQYAVGPDGHLIVPQPNSEPNVETATMVNPNGSFQMTGVDDTGNVYIGNFTKDGDLVSDSWRTSEGASGVDSYSSVDGVPQIVNFDVNIAGGDFNVFPVDTTPLFDVTPSPELPPPIAGDTPLNDFPLPVVGDTPSYDFPMPVAGDTPSYDFPMPVVGDTSSYDFPLPVVGDTSSYDFPLPVLGDTPSYDFPMPVVGDNPSYDFALPVVGDTPSYDFPMPVVGDNPSYDFPMPVVGDTPSYDFPMPVVGDNPSYDFPMPGIGNTPSYDYAPSYDTYSSYDSYGSYSSYDYAPSYSSYDYAPSYSSYDYAPSYSSYDYAPSYSSYDYAPSYSSYDYAPSYSSYSPSYSSYDYTPSYSSYSPSYSSYSPSYGAYNYY